MASRAGSRSAGGVDGALAVGAVGHGGVACPGLRGADLPDRVFEDGAQPRQPLGHPGLPVPGLAGQGVHRHWQQRIVRAHAALPGPDPDPVLGQPVKGASVRDVPGDDPQHVADGTGTTGILPSGSLTAGPLGGQGGDVRSEGSGHV
jgi:hypothetical protein